MSKLLTEIRWILQVALCAFLVMALLSYSRRDPSWTHAAQVDHITNWAGRVGAWTADIILLLFGLSAYWLIVPLARRIAVNYRRITRHEAVSDEPERPIGWLTEILAFVLVVLACDGIEALRMWSLKVQLPRAPGGVVGRPSRSAMSHAFGFTGGTLLLLIALAIGLSLFPLLVAVGRRACRRRDPVRRQRREAAPRGQRDRKLGEAAAVRREGKVEEERVRIEDQARDDRAAGRHAGEVRACRARAQGAALHRPAGRFDAARGIAARSRAEGGRRFPPTRSSSRRA